MIIIIIMISDLNHWTPGSGTADLSTKTRPAEIFQGA